LVSVSGAHLHSRPWEDETPPATAAPHIFPDFAAGLDFAAAKRAARGWELAVRAVGDPADAAAVALRAVHRFPFRAGLRLRRATGGAEQRVDAVRVGPNDVALDVVATEHGIIRRGKN
jgi:hypothetical protein